MHTNGTVTCDVGKLSYESHCLPCGDGCLECSADENGSTEGMCADTGCQGGLANLDGNCVDPKTFVREDDEEGNE